MKGFQVLSGSMEKKQNAIQKYVLPVLLLLGAWGACIGVASASNDAWLDSLQGTKGMTVGDLVPKYDDLLGEPGGGQPATGRTTTGGDDGQGIDTTAGDDGSEGEVVPVNPVALDPGSPEVAGLIREWIMVARPPADAVEGANLGYSAKGLIVGKASSGIITSRHESGIVDPVFLWRNKRMLDSVNHCTMEGYVVAKLEGKPVGHCLGRYGAVRDLTGVPLSQAKVEVQEKGFSTSLSVGSPAETKDQEGTVERQEPGADKYLKRGGQVTLFVHSRYVPPGSVLPDFIGKTLQEAKKWLEKNNFTADIIIGRMASDAASSGTIAGQEPMAGTQMAGGNVTLTVYAPYVERMTVPDLHNLPLADAKAILSEKGLGCTISLGSNPQSPDLSETVESQNPPPGTEIKKGVNIALTIRNRYVETLVVPDVVGLPLSEAKQRLASVGLQSDIKPGGSPASREQEGKVAEQDPPGGTAIAPGPKVTLFVHGQFIETAYVPDLSGLTLEQARQRLSSLGLNLRQEKSGTPARRELAHTVSKQYPVPGTRVARGHSVQAWLYSDYILTRDDQIANTDCSRYEGSKAYWDESENIPKCGCFDGLVWSTNKSKCVTTTAKEQEICSSRAPGMIPSGRNSSGELVCSCPQGTVWDQGKEKCVSRQIRTERQSGWRLVETQINPLGEITEYISGVTPYYYGESRYQGKYDKYIVKETSFSLRKYDVDRGFVFADILLQVNFDKPPEVLVPGESVRLSATFINQGTVNQSNPGIRFSYSAKGLTLQGTPRGAFFPYSNPQTAPPVVDTSFTAPPLRENSEIIITASMGFAACTVNWIYRSKIEQTSDQVIGSRNVQEQIQGNWSGQGALSPEDSRALLEPMNATGKVGYLITLQINRGGRVQGRTSLSGFSNEDEALPVTGSVQGNRIFFSGAEEGSEIRYDGTVNGASMSGGLEMTVPEMRCVVTNLMNNTDYPCPQKTYKGSWSATKQ